MPTKGKALMVMLIDVRLGYRQYPVSKEPKEQHKQNHEPAPCTLEGTVYELSSS